MSNQHYGGNTVPEVTREEHEGSLNAKRVVYVAQAPTSSNTGNPSYVLTYDGSGNLTDIDKTMDGATYHKDLTYTRSNLTAISTWTQV